MAHAADGNPFADLDSRLEEIFEKADDFMINKKSYKDAAKLFEEILALDPENIDALNSLAQCIKMQMLPGQALFDKVYPLYETAI